jgi:uncharacterized protein
MPRKINYRWQDLFADSGCSAEIRAHCTAVASIARDYAGSPLVDRTLVEAGSLLHDIGRCRSHRVDHARIGAALCRSRGIDEKICMIVERHIGAGLTADECSLLGLIPRDSVPQSLEERIVAHADNLANGKDRQCIERLLGNSTFLPRRIRMRILRLALQMELFKE